jgi:hypothetical protein
MPAWKLPPKEKIYEAFSVLADERYTLEESSGTITSSDGQKQYSVEWISHEEPDKSLKIISNDNASYWQGYLGYPIIAVLMIIEKIRFNGEIVHHFKDIPWNALNKAHKNDYPAVVNKVLSEIEDKKEVELITREVESIYRQLESLKPERLGKNVRPPGKFKNKPG